MKDRELQHRFKLIQEALGETTSPKLAFATAAAAWLQALQYASKRCMVRVRGDSLVTIDELEDELQEIFMAFHREICEYLEVDHAEAVKLGRNFREVLKDILDSKGGPE